MVREAPAQLPRLARIEQLDPATRISLGLLLDEQARRAPKDVAFLFGDRAHRQDDVKVRVDNVVKGLVSIGVRHGDRVGVLMDTRPSAFTLVAALSRLGATAVLLRPDGDLAREAALGQVTWVISDPEHVELAEQVDDVRRAVLGGGGPEWPRACTPRRIDMERIDPDDVELPAWYQPNPHRAGDVAFVLFTGEGAQTKALQITNRRWALSALGTASAAALKPGDTVYSVTPIHHSSALLMSDRRRRGRRRPVRDGHRRRPRHVLGRGAPLRRHPRLLHLDVAGDGRGRAAQPATSRTTRSGCSWARACRATSGAGSPSASPTAKVLEFYASAEGEVILANLTGRAPGSMGRPLPGTAEVRVAAFDLATRRLVLDERGLARECAPDEVGLLLARVNPADSDGRRADAGRVRERRRLALDRRSVPARRARRPVAGRPGGRGRRHRRRPGHPVRARASPSPRSRPSTSSSPTASTTAARRCSSPRARCARAPTSAPATWTRRSASCRRCSARATSRWSPSIPMTTWHRPQWRTLQAKGVPTPSRTRRVWRLDPDRAHYEPVT